MNATDKAAEHQHRLERLLADGHNVAIWTNDPFALKAYEEAIRPTVTSLYAEVAAAHNIHTSEAIDEVWDAIEILWAREDRPEETVTAYQRQAILEYIAEQYRTNRTRL